MSKPPKSVDVGPYPHRVSHKTKPIAKEVERTGKDLYGFYDEQTLTIHVHPETAPSLQRETLLHELLHAVIAVSGVKVKNEERVIRALSPVLLDTLRRNPELADYLLTP